MALDTSRQDVESLWDTLRDYLDFQLMVHTDRRHWESLDTVSNKDLEGYKACIHSAINETREKYVGTNVESVLDELAYAVYASVRTGMSVPYPTVFFGIFIIENLIERVLNTTMMIMDDFYDDLLHKMFIVNNRVLKIQNMWRKVNSNPEYKACRNRLLREFRQLENTI
jgi:hypothetical protein